MLYQDFWGTKCGLIRTNKDSFEGNLRENYLPVISHKQDWETTPVFTDEETGLIVAKIY